MDKQKIGDFIKKKRKEKGLTQKELADKLFITDRAISKWERGICCPDISILRDLCKLLDININELLTGGELDMISEEDKNNLLVDTVKAYTDIYKKKNKNLLIFTIIILILYIFLVIGMYLTFNQLTGRDGINFEVMQTKSIADKFLTVLEKGDYEGLRKIVNKYLDVDYYNENENKCNEYIGDNIKDKWMGPVCRLKDFNDNGIKFKKHKLAYQSYVGQGEYWVTYEVTINYKNVDSQMVVSFATHNGKLNHISGSCPGNEISEREYNDIREKICLFFYYYGDEDMYLKTMNK